MAEATGIGTGASIGIIHEGTSIYTQPHEIDALLDRISWPQTGERLLDPGCGNGNMVVAALARIMPAPGDLQAVSRVHGMDFHEPSITEARTRISDLLISLGWSGDEAAATASKCVETRDYLLDRPAGTWDVILANPPYWRRANLPAEYRERLDEALPRHATGDLLHAYLHAMLGNLSEGGCMAIITSDRWLLNSSASSIRSEVGRRLRVADVRRLDTASAFHRPKDRTRGTPPRVHAVSMLLQDADGRTIDERPFLIEEPPHVDGTPLGELVEMRLAPWLGADNVFMVPSGSGLPEESLVPCVEPSDLCPRTDTIGPTRRWAILTGDERPHEDILEHLERNMHRMPPRGVRKVRWLPPERFDGRLPLQKDAILVPRLARKLRAIRLPAGMLPTNHSLVLVSGRSVESIQRMLLDPRVQAQADALALRVEDGYRSYTATLLRQLVIPNDLIELERKAA